MNSLSLTFIYLQFCRQNQVKKRSVPSHQWSAAYTFFPTRTHLGSLPFASHKPKCVTEITAYWLRTLTHSQLPFWAACRSKYLSSTTDRQKILWRHWRFPVRLSCDTERAGSFSVTVLLQTHWFLGQTVFGGEEQTATPIALKGQVQHQKIFRTEERWTLNSSRMDPWQEQDNVCTKTKQQQQNPGSPIYSN